MKISRAKKFLLSLLLCGSFLGCAQAKLEYTTILSSKTTMEIVYTDAEGNEQTYKYTSKLATPVTASLSVKYSSPNGGSGTTYYAWTSNGFVQVTDASSADVTVSWTKSSSYPKGIYNDGSTSSLQGKNISGDFVKLNKENGGYDNVGGAIENIAGWDESTNNATLGNITGNFVGNYVILSPGEGEETYPAAGGAIFNYATGEYSAEIGNITGNFIGNSTTGTASGNSNGGAIFNEGNNGGTAKIGAITGDFVGNAAIDDGDASDDATPTAAGGAIYNYANGDDAKATIGDIKGNFYGNSAQAYGSANSHGGAINNSAGGSSSETGEEATIGNITGDFIGNYATSESKAAWGGAILNIASADGSTATIGNITGDFMGNYVSAAHNAFGGAIHNRTNDDSTGTTATIGNIKGDFVGNYAESTGDSTYGAYGGAIANYLHDGNSENDTAKIGTLSGVFAYNHVTAAGNAEGGAIFNGSTGTVSGTASIDGITGSNFVGNYAESTGGEAYGGAIFNNGTLTTITNSSFINNYVTGTEAQGGAIYTTTDLTIAADGADVVFVGNAANGESNAIYMATADTTLKFSLKNGGSIAMYDVISGNDSGYDVEISGDGLDTTFYLLNDIENAGLSVGSTTLSTTTNTLSDVVHVYKLSSFALTSDINMEVDVDLASETMDRISAESYESLAGTLTVSGTNGLTDTEKDSVEIFFAEDGLKDNVTSSVSTTYAPIYRYDTTYEVKDDGGYFIFDKSGFNPAVMASSIAQMGAYNAMGLMYEYNFEHSDYYAKLPADVRLAMGEEQRKAKKAPKENDPTEAAYYNRNELTERGAWFKSFFSNESVSYRASEWGSRDKYYGALVGFDSNLRDHGNGWASVFTGYAGTLEIRQEYSGGHIKQHGGFAGLTESFYKKNFYTAWTVAAGMNKVHDHTMYGHEKSRLYDYGIAGRFGWNFDLGGGKFSLLPTFTASYSYIDPKDFTNAANVHLTGNGLRAVQLNPNVKFIMNMKGGLQPYLTVGEIWTVGQSATVRANGNKLDELELKPYTEYGAGIQKRWTNDCDAYVQVLGHSHGRDGVVVNGGLRWNF